MSKQRMTAMFIVAADDSFAFEPGILRCFRSLKDPSRPMSVHYFSNSEVWKNSGIMETALGRLDGRINF